jgi:hypothetical protein
MKYKIHYKSLDSITNKEIIINKIKEFYKNKHHFEQRDFDNMTTFSWSQYLPGFGTNAKSIILVVDWEYYTIYITEDASYMPFNNKELEFFDKLGFELSDNFSYITEQNIYDWTGM